MGRILDWFLGVPELQTRAEDEAPPRPPAGSGVTPPAPDRRVGVTTDVALGLDAVYRAVSIIATGLAQLSLDVERGGHPIAAPSWVKEPDATAATTEAFWEETTNALALNGNAFWLVDRDRDSGVIRNLRHLPPLDVAVSLDTQTGVRTYGWNGRDYTAREVRHLALLRIPGRGRGLGPIQAAQASLSGAVDLRDYSASWFRDAGVPTGTLTSDQHLSPEQAAEYKQRWNDAMRQQRGVAILGAGLAYEPVLLSPQEAQFIQSQQFTVTSLARLFGIPANLVLAAVEGSAMTYQNVAQADLSFVRWTLSKYTREIESAVSALLPRGQRARFNLDALLRPDTKSRYEAHAIALKNKWLTIDEVRAIEGYGPLQGGTP